VLKIRDQEVQEYKGFNNIKRSIRSRVSRVSDQEIPDYQEIKKFENIKTFKNIKRSRRSRRSRIIAKKGSRLHNS